MNNVIDLTSFKSYRASLVGASHCNVIVDLMDRDGWLLGFPFIFLGETVSIPFAGKTVTGIVIDIIRSANGEKMRIVFRPSEADGEHIQEYWRRME